MTVSSQTNNETFYGNGATTVWDLPFRFFDNGDIQAYLIDSATQQATPLVLGTDYALTGAGIPEQFGAAPGKITTFVPVATGNQLYVERVMTVEQLTDILNQGRFFAEVHEDVFDRLTMFDQQALSLLSRALVRPAGRNYYDAEGRQIKNLGDGSADPDAVNIRTMRTYVDNSIAGVVGGQGFFQQSGTGAVPRTYLQKMREIISILDFGAIGDGTYHQVLEWYTIGFAAYRGYANLAAVQVDYPHVTSSADSIDWTAAQAALNVAKGRGIYAPGVGTAYVMSRGLRGVDGERVTMFGDGATPFYLDFQVIPYTNTGGTDFIYIGTGQKECTVYGISDMAPCGGVRTDPDLGVVHALTNFTNGDATPLAAATPKAFSAGLYLSHSGGSSISGIRMAPNFNGLSSYTDPLNLGLADDWDVGICLDSCYDTVIDSACAVGHWRMVGLADLAAENPFSGGASSSGERNHFYNCQFNGKTGVAIRGGDAYRCTAVTATTVEIPWHDSNPFRHTGGVFLGAFGGATSASYTYTGATVTGDKLTLTGVSPNPVANGMTTQSGVYTSRSFGFQGTQFFGCYIGGLEHQASRVATDPALTSPFPTTSKALEITGVPAGNIRFFGCTFMTREDCMWMLHNTSNIYDFGGFFEAKRAVTATGGGNRMISIGNWPDFTPTAETPYPFGTVSTVHMLESQALNFVDMFPTISRSTGVTRFTTGMYDCKTTYSTEAQQDISETNAFVIRGLRNETIRFEDGAGAGLFAMQNIGNFQMIKRARFNTLTEDRYQFFRLDGSTVILSLDGTLATPVITIDGNFVPLVANTRLIGTAAKPFSGGNTQTAYNVTSDRDYKTDIEPIPDCVLDAWATIEYSQFRLNDSVLLKGDDARTHVGNIAQEVRDAFVMAGIDPFKYGLLCYDEWPEELEVIGENGEVEREYQAAGKRYSLRYEEALALEAALMRRTTRRLEQRLAALEAP